MYKILTILQQMATATLNEAEQPNLTYDGSIDPEISNYNVDGTGYKLYVNESDPTYPNGMTFSISSDDDDGVTWEIDLGEPEVSSHGGYEPDSDNGPGGYDDVKFDRSSHRSPVRVDSQTTNPLLKTFAGPVSAKLSEITDASNQSKQIQDLLVSVVDKLNA